MHSDDQLALDCVKMGQYVLRFESDENISDFFAEKARTELRETSELKEQSLLQLKKLITNDEELYLPIEDEAYLSAFLRTCKYYPESAYRRIRQIYKFKNKHSKYFGRIVPDSEINVFQNNLLTVLPQRDQQGRRILIIQPGCKWNPSQCSLTEITRGVLLVIAAAILEPKTQISGAVLIMDLEGLTLQHIWNISPSYAKMALEWVQDSMPLRIKAVHIINQPYIFNMAFAVFKPFIRQKLRNRIHLHGSDHMSLLNHIDPKFVPVQYGGMMDISLDSGLLLWQLLCQYSDDYRRTSTYGYKRGKNGIKNDESE